MPGMPSAVKKMATPAKAMRMTMAALVESPENTRSPMRVTVGPSTSAERSVRVVFTALLEFPCDWAGRPTAREDASGGRIQSRCRDRVDGGLDLLGDRVGQRRGAGILRGHFLAFGASDVGQPTLDQIGLGLV